MCTKNIIAIPKTIHKSNTTSILRDTLCMSMVQWHKITPTVWSPYYKAPLLYWHITIFCTTSSCYISTVVTLHYTCDSVRTCDQYYWCSLVPRPLPDFILQPLFLHGCEIKSESGLGTRLLFVNVPASLQTKRLYCPSNWHVAILTIL